jgi:RNA polymerase sigma-70 factor (ECF subfamily)
MAGLNCCDHSPYFFTGFSMTEFRARIEEEIPRLRRYARALTRNGSRSDDLIQDTLVRALAKEHLWEPGTNMRAWLFTIMHNQNVNAVRSAMREGMTVEIEEQSSNLVATTDPTSARQLHELDRALAQIPEEQRQVILLVGLEGMSYEDSAAILHIPVGTVRSRLSRGRDALRKLMGMGERTVEPGPNSLLPTETAITAGVLAA